MFIYFDRWDGWLSYPITIPEPYSDESIARKLQAMKDEGSFTLDPECLGGTRDWQDVQVTFEQGETVPPDFFTT